ncbi:SRPBCC family protein [Microbacterium sp. NPDC019599]|uniref:SRPBCC family protein n=1 Tax=Microbacterium sp. NPDC019599 TaxID=3154690 RepID=UPI00340CD70F
MVHLKTTIVIRRTQEETFDYITDLRNATEWAAELVDITYDGDLRLGATGVEVRRRGKKEFTWPWTVTAYERPNRIILEYGRPYPAIAEFTFVRDADGTRFTCDTELRLEGLQRMLSPLVAAEGRRIDAAQFRKAKEILESQGTAADHAREGRKP